MNIAPKRYDEVKMIEAARMNQVRADRQIYRNSQNLGYSSKSHMAKRLQSKYQNQSTDQSIWEPPVDISDLMIQPQTQHYKKQDQTPSPLFMGRKGDSLNVSDIKGTKPDHLKRVRHLRGRETNLIQDIPGAIKKEPVVKYRDEKSMFVQDDRLVGRKKKYFKDSDPLMPTYNLKTISGRMQVIGSIDGNQPKTLIQKSVNKDTRRYLGNGDISGTRTQLKGICPKSRLPELSPDREYIMTQQRQNLKDSTLKMRDYQTQGNSGGVIQQEYLQQVLNKPQGLTQQMNTVNASPQRQMKKDLSNFQSQFPYKEIKEQTGPQSPPLPTKKTSQHKHSLSYQVIDQNEPDLTREDLDSKRKSVLENQRTNLENQRIEREMQKKLRQIKERSRLNIFEEPSRQQPKKSKETQIQMREKQILSQTRIPGNMEPLRQQSNMSPQISKEQFNTLKQTYNSNQQDQKAPSQRRFNSRQMMVAGAEGHSFGGAGSMRNNNINPYQ